MVFPNIHVLPLFFEYNYALMLSFKDNSIDRLEFLFGMSLQPFQSALIGQMLYLENHVIFS